MPLIALLRHSTNPETPVSLERTDDSNMTTMIANIHTTLLPVGDVKEVADVIAAEVQSLLRARILKSQIMLKFKCQFLGFTQG